MSDDTRTFHYADGASDKFWSIALRGTATAVQFGRLGTAGQRQVKEHGTANAARAAYDRLVAEKVKKGYVETVPGRESTPRDADDLVATEGTGDRAARSAAAPPSAEHTSATATSHTDATMEAATHVDAPEIAPVSTTPILSSPAMLTTATSFLSAPPEPQATAPAVEPRRSIALDPEDWYWATWRRLEPLRRPEPAPFDRNDALARLRQVKRRAYEDVGTVGYMATAGYNWSPAGIAPALTPDEARFWLRAMARVRDVMATVDEVADRLAREDDAAEFSLDDARAALGDDAESNVTPPPDILSPLVNLFPLATVIDLLIGDTRPRPLDWRWRQHYVAERELALAHGFRTFILPYLTVEEKEQARQRIRGALDPAAWPADHSDTPPLAFFLAATVGLHEELSAIGSDGALMAIGGIAQKLKFKGLQAKARAAMEDIARARGLTRAQLEDRVVPDCDLDERGSRTFDLGGRRFTFTLGAGLTPLLRDERGAPRPALPKPTAKDDPALVARAAEDWKLLKKEVAEVAKIQAVRLEQAMVTGRRWTPTEFETLLARHPLMTHLARLLIWGRYDGGALTATFRLTEDSGYADSKDEPFALDDKGTIGVVHPLRLSADERSAWGEILSDYETVPPFPQLSRPLYYLEPDEAAAQELARYKDVKIAPQTLVYTLERLDWVRGTPMDAGTFDEHSKPFESAGVTAVLTYRDGVPVGDMEGWDDQTLDACVFVRGITGPSGFRRYQQLDMVPPREVDSVVISEVLGDLTVVAAKRTV